MKCSKCGSDQTELRSGISKKNGKPWSGYKCQECDNMDFVRQKRSQEAPKREFIGQNPPKKAIPEVSSTPEQTASQVAARLCECLANNGAYVKGITEEDHNKMFEQIYSDFTNFKNRLLPPKAESEEMGFEENSF